MADASVRRRGHGEDAIYFAADKNRYIGAVSVGFGPDGRRLRRKVSGKTKQEVRGKLKAFHAELDIGLQPAAGYTVQAAVDDAVSAHVARDGGGQGGGPRYVRTIRT